MNDSIDNIFKSLTVEEKVRLCGGKDFWHLHGVERLGLPSIMVTDGPHGLRKQGGRSDHVGLSESVPATCFPTASGLAATWNLELVRRMGVALAEECLAEQVSVLLGPGANLKRHPLGGRNFEYFSEDPYVSGVMATAWIDGVQSRGVGASLKHYALNNHEKGRMVVDVVADERTVRELYLPAWERCVLETKPWTIMCAYNKFRGVYLSENEYLLKTVLREEWGFDGVVVTDWGANHDRVKGVINGQSLEMPASGDINPNRILAALNDGSLTEEQLDESVRPVVDLIAKSAASLDESAEVNLKANHDLARSVAEEASVLLKNEDEILPLEKSAKILVVGALATETRYQGSGSSQIVPTQLEQPLEEIEVLADDGCVTFAAGYAIVEREGEDIALCEEAVHLAVDAERIVVVAGLTPEYESEGFDRTHMQLPANQLNLIDALQEHHHKTVVVLQNGAPVALPFRNSVKAILEAYLGGQAGASAMARILYGDVNPSGKLAETFPVVQSDVPSDQWFPGEYRQSQYREGIWVGYRYFDTAGKTVAYPFGHGLSYTSFEYTDLTIDTPEAFNETSVVTVSCSVTNSGSKAGAEVVQVYIGQENSSVPRPDKELKAYVKVFLAPGETQAVSMLLDYRAFAFWSTASDAWQVESDEYVINVGASVVDIRLMETVQINSGESIGERSPALASYFEPGKLDFDDATFRALLEHDIPKPLAIKPFQLNSTLHEIKSNWLGRRVNKLAKAQIQKMLSGDSTPTEQELWLVEAIVSEMPLRTILSMSQGKMKPGLVYRLIHAMNNNWFKVIFGGPVRSE